MRYLHILFWNSQKPYGPTHPNLESNKKSLFPHPYLNFSSNIPYNSPSASSYILLTHSTINWGAPSQNNQYAGFAPQSYLNHHRARPPITSATLALKASQPPRYPSSRTQTTSFRGLLKTRRNDILWYYR